MQVIILKKKTKILGSIWIVAALLNVGLNIVLVPYIGIIAAALTTLLTYILVFIAIAAYTHQYLRFHIDVVNLLKILGASLVMSFVIILIAPASVLSILGTVALSVIVYGAVMIGLRGFSNEEYAFFKTLLRKGT